MYYQMDHWRYRLGYVFDKEGHFKIEFEIYIVDLSRPDNNNQKKLWLHQSNVA